MPLNLWISPYLRFGPFSLSAYSLFLYTGATLWLALFLRAARRSDELTELDALNLGSLIVLSGALFGGILSYFLYGNFGPSFYMAGLAATITGYLYCRYRKVSPLHVGDLGTPAAAAAFAVMKLGCLVGGCCYGTTTGLKCYAVYASHSGEPQPRVLVDNPAWENVPLVPIQLWIALLALLIFLLLKLFEKRLRETPGHTITLALGLYAAGRWALDFLSGERPAARVLGMSENQWVGLAVVAICSALWVRSIKPGPV